MAKKRNVRKILKLRLNPIDVRGWYNNGNEQSHLDKLFQFVIENKNATCPQEIVEKLRTAKLTNEYQITIAMRLHDAERLRRRLYASPWYNGDVVRSTEITKIQ